MKCLKCKKEIPDMSIYCMYCGKKQVKNVKNNKQRGNGQGSVYKLSNGTWRCVVTTGYTLDNKRHTRTKSGFKTKKEALEYIPILQKKTLASNDMTLRQLFDVWFEQYEATENRLRTIRILFNTLKPLWDKRLNDLTIDDYQNHFNIMSGSKGHKSNVKSVLSFLYGYAIPRGYIDNNLDVPKYIHLKSDPKSKKQLRDSFTREELELVKKSADNGDTISKYIMCLCYTGFRANEFLSLTIQDNYNKDEHLFIGGSKTEAGKNRTVTISPKIQPYIDEIIGDRTEGYVFCNSKSQQYIYATFKVHFINTLSNIGVSRRLTPHCARHTFASLMMRVNADDKQKISLIGHTSTDMLRHYQHTDYNDLREVTDNL